MLHSLLEVFTQTSASDVDGFRRDFREEADRWMSQRQGTRHSGAATPLQQYMIGVVAAARRNRLRLAPRILSMYRALLTIEAVATRLDSSDELGVVAKRFFSRLQVDRTIDDLATEKVTAVALDVLALLKDGPGHFQRLLSDLAGNRFVLPVKASQSREDTAQANVRAKLVAASVASVGVAVVLATIDRFLSLGWFHPSWIAWALLIGVYAWIVRLYTKLS
jgi:predicted unusual protein kinase regulating ubiquinone biosynthesis (AarF/ABC1/UbiB family)